MKMSVKCDKMLLIPRSTNHWPQCEEKAMRKLMGGSITEKASSSKEQQEEAEKCPRCESSNTKFCYYNNYSLSQPRYLCKACKRYWTKGGTLRNVPVGGGCRKNKRATPPLIKRSSSTSSSHHHHHHHHHHHIPPPPINPLFYGGFPNNNISMSREWNTTRTTFEGPLVEPPEMQMGGGTSTDEQLLVVPSSQEVMNKGLQNHQLEEHEHEATTSSSSFSSLYYWNNNLMPMLGGIIWNN